MYHVLDYKLEPQEISIFCYCAHCGGEIYEREDIYDIDGDLIHEYCLRDYFEGFKKIAERVSA